MRNKNFTLIELIVVIAIIAILAAIITPNAFRAIEKSKVAKAAADIKTLSKALYALYADTGKWPKAVNLFPLDSHLAQNACVAGWTPHGWSAFDCGPWEGWNGPYIERGRGTCVTPWGGAYLIQNGALTCIVGSPINLTGGSEGELWIDIDDYCYPSGPNAECAVPHHSAEMIDRSQDDGNLGTGNVQGGGSSSWGDDWDVHWILYVDMPPTPCW